MGKQAAQQTLWLGLGSQFLIAMLIQFSSACLTMRNNNINIYQSAVTFLSNLHSFAFANSRYLCLSKNKRANAR